MGRISREIADDLVPLELGHDGHLRPQLAQEGPHLLDVGRRADERHGHEVDALLDPEAQIRAILLGQARRGKRHARHGHALVIAEAPAHQDPAADLASIHRLDPQLHEAVVHEDLVARAHLTQRLGGHDRGALDRPHHGLRRQGEEGAGLEVDATASAHPERSQPDLGSLEILEDGDGAPPPRLSGAETMDDVGVLRVRPVREVEPGDVHPRPREAIELFRTGAGRADGADDLRPRPAHASARQLRWRVAPAAGSTRSGRPGGTARCRRCRPAPQSPPAFPWPPRVRRHPRPRARDRSPSPPS